MAVGSTVATSDKHPLDQVLPTISQEDEERLEGEAPADRGQARRAEDGSTLSEIDLPRQPGDSHTPKP